MSASWFDMLAAGMSGGLVVKLVDYLYAEYLRRSKAKKSAKEIIDRHIDPILKSSDELVGKIRSLAQSDFQAIKNISIRGAEPIPAISCSKRATRVKNTLFHSIVPKVSVELLV